jgi:hypothetical protein
MSSSPILPIALVASIRTPRSFPRRPTPSGLLSTSAMRPPTYLTILRALLRASNDVVSATWRNRANLPVAAGSSTPCKIASRAHLEATLSRCARGQPACAAHLATATTASD